MFVHQNDDILGNAYQYSTRDEYCQHIFEYLTDKQAKTTSLIMYIMYNFLALFMILKGFNLRVRPISLINFT